MLAKTPGRGETLPRGARGFSGHRQPIGETAKAVSRYARTAARSLPVLTTGPSPRVATGNGRVELERH